MPEWLSLVKGIDTVTPKGVLARGTKVEATIGNVGGAKLNFKEADVTRRLKWSAGPFIAHMMRMPMQIELDLEGRGDGTTATIVFKTNPMIATIRGMMTGLKFSDEAPATVRDLKAAVRKGLGAVSLLGSIFHPIGRLEDSVEHEVGPPALRRIEASIGVRSMMPLLGLGFMAVGLALIVALTISVGAHSDNFAGASGQVLDAVQFRNTLLVGVGLLLAGTVTLLLAITVRIWWLTYTNRTLLPPAIHAARQREGRKPLFAVVTGSDGNVSERT